MAYNEPSVTDLSTTGLLLIRQIVGDRKRGYNRLSALVDQDSSPASGRECTREACCSANAACGPLIRSEL